MPQLSRAWQVSVKLCSPHAAQGPAAGGIGYLGFHLTATKHFREVFLLLLQFSRLADRDGSHELCGF